jgi:hypothetical protein
VSEHEAFRDAMNLLVRKLVLGDDEAKRIMEDRGMRAVDARTELELTRRGLCPCRRSDGMFCTRSLAAGNSLCWPCWSAARDDKPCNHRL